MGKQNVHKFIRIPSVMMRNPSHPMPSAPELYSVKPLIENQATIPRRAAKMKFLTSAFLFLLLASGSLALEALPIDESASGEMMDTNTDLELRAQCPPRFPGYSNNIIFSHYCYWLSKPETSALPHFEASRVSPGSRVRAENYQEAKRRTITVKAFQLHNVPADEARTCIQETFLFEDHDEVL
ncbi:hypothetical protein AJ80_09299 [Polytolypa hystricis UAMH7299]|uniref:Uncharacterized protein n=1 Tax=Polytolypa hystricis (strain UAMH7299) TaxID=1447883 RepID=A0A2B7WSJ7_POLH7|nr:hypothetical protein AJ80_09299 [Polytolypa hystricis UAMH7299]